MQISRSKLNQKRYNDIKKKRIIEHQDFTKLRRIEQSRSTIGRPVSEYDSMIWREEQCNYGDDDRDEKNVWRETPSSRKGE